MASEEAGSDTSSWSREQDKAFENSIAAHFIEDGGGDGERWEKIAEGVPGKTALDVKRHYELLVDDVDSIESGRVPLLCYLVPSPEGSADNADDGGSGKKEKSGGNSGQQQGDSGHGGKSSRSDQERRKGIAWTEDEHRLFLLGLEKYGKGDWRSISRNFVITRTPTQVASHAQKYFIRLNSMNKDRRRSSIHDITSVDNGDLSSSQGPITGQTNAPATSTGKPSKPTLQQPPGPAGVGVYGTPTIGQPIGGPLVSAVGTPVNMPAPPHLAYPVRAPVPGTIVPGAPVTYPMPPHTAAHR